MFRALVLAALTMLSACAREEPLAFDLSSLDADTAAAVRSAGDEWCERAGHCVSYGSHGVPVRLTVTDEWVGCTTLDGRTDQPKLVQIARGLDATTLRAVALHELGHAFGCGEHLEPGNVMTTFVEDQPEHLTESDLTCSQ